MPFFVFFAFFVFIFRFFLSKTKNESPIGEFSTPQFKSGLHDDIDEDQGEKRPQDPDDLGTIPIAATEADFTFSLFLFSLSATLVERDVSAFTFRFASFFPWVPCFYVFPYFSLCVLLFLADCIVACTPLLQQLRRL